MKNVENMMDYNNFNNDTSETIRNNIINSVNSHINKKKHITYEDRIFAQRLRKTETFIKENDVFFTMADKGNVTVAIDNEQYKQKMDILLLDKGTYTQVKSNPSQYRTQ